MQASRVIPRSRDAVPPRILVVDDEVLIRLVATVILHDAGCHVVEASGADEAVTVLAAGTPFDLIVTDVKMPGAIDGIGLLAYVKQHYPALPVVLTSGHLAAHELRRAGCDDLLPKPYSAAALLSVIERVLGRLAGDGK